ncbi:hypothetical protein D3C76_1606400 [compost metagenome]
MVRVRTEATDHSLIVPGSPKGEPKIGPQKQIKEQLYYNDHERHNYQRRNRGEQSVHSK